METPTRVSSPASSSVHCQDNNERDDEISTPDDEEIRSMSADMTRGVDTAISSVNNDLPTVSTECQEEFLKDILSYASSLFPEFSFVMSRACIDGTKLPVLIITPLQVFNHPPLELCHDFKS